MPTVQPVVSNLKTWLNRIDDSLSQMFCPISKSELAKILRGFILKRPLKTIVERIHGVRFIDGVSHPLRHPASRSALRRIASLDCAKQDAPRSLGVGGPFVLRLSFREQRC